MENSYSWQEKKGKQPDIRSITWTELEYWPVFSKLSWWKRLIGKEVEFLGFECNGYVGLTNNELCYLRPNDVITFDGVGKWVIKWVEESSIYGTRYRVGTIKPIQFKFPLSSGSFVTKLFTIHYES
jgi:hypothetical protein